MAPDRRPLLISALIIAAVLAALAILGGCGEQQRPQDEPVPAQLEADRLGHLAEDDALAAAAAQAEADILAEQAKAKTPTNPDEAARLQAKADDARLRAAIADARATAAKQLRADATARAVAERAEVQALGDRAATAAAKRAAEEALQRDRRWAGIAIGACVAAGIALTVIGLPAWAAIGLPAAAAGGLLWVAAWSSVPWLAQALGLGLVCILLVAVAGLALLVTREWRRHADDVERLGRAAADAASIERQPVWARPFVSWLLRRSSAPITNSSGVDHA